MVDASTKEELENLILRCQTGDRQAFMELVKSHQNMVFAVLYRMMKDRQEVEDLAQEVWVKVYQSIRKLKAPGAFRSWLHRIALNTFRDRMRQKGHHIAFSLDEGYEMDNGDQVKVELEAPGLLPEETLLQGEWKTHLDEAILDLPEAHRAVIVMREIQGLSYDEIAYALDISLGTVKSRIARAREKLVMRLSEYMKEKENKHHD